MQTYLNTKSVSLLIWIQLPDEALICEDKHCQSHIDHLSKFHDDIIFALLEAGDKALPIARPVVSKVMPGWNNYVHKYFQSSLLWHNIWKANGQPSEGVIADLRRKTRSQYHKVCKMVMRHEGTIKSEKMAEALLNGDSCSLKFRPKKAYFPSMVDDVVGPKEIAKVFAQKFDELYNCVSYDSDEMDVLLTTIHKSIDNKCTRTRVHGSHCISAKDVNKAICKLKASKSDGCTRLLADHIINAGDKLCTYLSLLFTAMLRHGSIPDGIFLGTMVPIPKGRWTNLNSSENFRAITLSSTFGKLIDLITLEKEGSKLGTSDLQFSFKDGASTSLCTAMVQETASYYVNGGSNVYGLLLDASKAFDRVNYCKLFRTLMNRGVCPLYSRLLLNMYTNQKLRARWNAEF